MAKITDKPQCYNDEEFEYLKGDVKRIVCQITEHEMIEQTERLIATVEQNP